MLNNYFNPNAFKPDGSGLMMQNGYDFEQDRQRYAEMAGLQKLLTEIELQKQNEDLKEGYGLRQAERGARTSGFNLERMVNEGAAGTRDYVPTMVGGKMGDAQLRSAQGREALGTVDSKITSTNATNQTSALENVARQLELRAAQGNLAVAPAYQQFYDSMPDHIKAGFPKQYTPEVPQLLRKLSEAVTNSPSHRRQMAVTQEQTRSAEAIGRGNNQTSRDVANINADARIEAAWARMGGSAAQHKVESIINQYLQLVMDGKEPTPQQHRAFQAAQQIMMNVRAAAGLPMDPNLLNYQLLNPGQQPPPRPVPQPVPPINPTPQKPPAQPQGQVTRQQVEAAGWSYEPQKYQYRIGPNGRLQRAPK